MDETKIRPTPTRLDASELRSIAEALSQSGRPHLRVVLNAPEPADPVIARVSYLAAIRRLEVSRAQRIACEMAEHATAHALAFEFVLPVLRIVEQERIAGTLSVGHEHLVAAQLRACLLARDEPVLEGAPRVVITSPLGHRGELGLLIAVHLTRRHGFEVVYLGAELADDQIAWSAKACCPHLVMIGVGQPLRPGERGRLASLFARLPETTKIWIGGRTLDRDTAPRPARAFTSYEALDEALAAETAGLFTQG